MTENGKSNKSAALVVGVDGSAGAAEALRWAVAEARLRKVPLRVVQAWTLGYAGVPVEGFAYMGSFSSNPSQGVDPAELQRVAEDVLGKAIGEVAGGVEGVEIERQVVQGGAAEVLLGTVAAGDLLVVGSRGHGGFAGLLLGSVSQQCVHYAPCAVVVVHSHKAPDAKRAVVGT
ncbi:MAG: universal stress protein [Candidatus Dormibacteraeota bacterium]|nr:universal stress protein [Candidatus Dormibacteraeota bacterium]